MTSQLAKLALAATVSVSFADVEVSVRGLSASDLIGIFDRNREIVEKLFAEIADDKMSTQDTLAKMLKTAPHLAAEIIAAATDDDSKVAQKLPVGVQIKLLEVTLQATTHVSGGLGELIGIVTGWIESLTVTARIDGTSVPPQNG